MELKIAVHHEATVTDLNVVHLKNITFAARWAANAVGENVKRGVVDAMLQKFTASTPGRQWMVKHVQVLRDRSKHGRSVLGQGRDASTSAFVGVIPPQGKGMHAGWERYRGSFLPMMEEGGPTPGPRRFGGRASGASSDFGRYAIQVRRRGDRTPLSLGKFPINLGLSARQSIEGPMRGGGLKGKQRTFMLPIVNSPGHAMIFQRFGRGKGSDVMPLFWTQRDTRLPARRYFFPTAERIVRERIADHVRRALAQAEHGRGAYQG